MHVSITPWNTRKVKQEQVVLSEGYMAEHETAFRYLVRLAKRFGIKYRDLLTHGFTTGCSKCDRC